MVLATLSLTILDAFNLYNWKLWDCSWDYHFDCHSHVLTCCCHFFCHFSLFSETSFSDFILWLSLISRTKNILLLSALLLHTCFFNDASEGSLRAMAGFPPFDPFCPLVAKWPGQWYCPFLIPAKIDLCHGTHLQQFNLFIFEVLKEEGCCGGSGEVL